jgi:hypothetical protein
MICIGLIQFLRAARHTTADLSPPIITVFPAGGDERVRAGRASGMLQRP